MSPDLQPGQEAPDFSLRDQHGRRTTLADFRGERSVVLVFYPFAFSGVCTGELRELTEQATRFEEAGAALLGVSCDPMFALRAYADRDEIPFPLLSDFWPHGEVAASYGVLDTERGCATRSTFVIDRAGRVRWQVHNPMGEARDVDAYLREVAAAQTSAPDRPGGK
jgi:peroxiredoxin (alkyl hydroperoxide reductase subunit C)